MQPGHIATANINLAATVIAAVNARLVTIDHSDPAVPRFVFVADDVVDVIEAHWSGTLHVDPVMLTVAEGYLRECLVLGVPAAEDDNDDRANPTAA